MLVALPEILFDAVEFKGGGWVLKEGATPEQKEAFAKFTEAMQMETVIFE